MRMNQIVCSICKVAAVNDIDEAINNEWIPSWFDKNNQQQEPACNDCVKSHLQQGQDGEFELIDATLN